MIDQNTINILSDWLAIVAMVVPLGYFTFMIYKKDKESGWYRK